MYEHIDEQLAQIANISPGYDCCWAEKEGIVKALQDKIGEYFDINVNDTNELEEIKARGYTKLLPLLNEGEINDIVSFLQDKLVYSSHIPPSDGKLRTVEQSRHLNAAACYTLPDLLACPHILEKVLDKGIINLVENYLGAVPTLYSLNTYWTFKEHGRQEGVKLFHRDIDDIKFCCLLIYLVDVDEQTGPFNYISYTHNEDICVEHIQDETFCSEIFPPKLISGHGNDTLFESKLSNNINVLTGVKGTTVLADTFGLHKGKGQLSKDRLMLWVRYGMHNNGSCQAQTPHPYEIDRQIELDSRLQYITRRLIKHV